MCSFEKYDSKNGTRVVTSSKSMKQLYDWMLTLDHLTLNAFDIPRDDGKSPTDVVIKITGAKIANTILDATDMARKFSNYKGNKNIKMTIMYSMADFWEFLQDLGTCGRAILDDHTKVFVRIKSDFNNNLRHLITTQIQTPD